MSDDLQNLANLGPVSRRWLREAGIECAADLRALGAVETYRRVRFVVGRHVSLNLLYALDASLSQCHWRDVSPARKAALRAELENVET